MTSIAENLIGDAVSAAPNSIAGQAVGAAVSTVENPSPMTLLSDIELAYQLVKEFKANMAGLHPSVANLVKALF